MIPNALADLTKPLYLGVYTLGRMEPRQVVGIGARTARERLVPALPVDVDARYERRVPDDPDVRPSPLASNTATLRASLADATRERYRRRAREAGDGTPTFLNRTLRVADGTDVEWYDDRFEDLPLLWALKLYGFQPLAWVCGGFEDATTVPSLQSTFDGWILDWIDSIEIGHRRYLRRAWTPWAVSLRILHWCRYLVWRASDGTGDGFERAFRRELYKNALFLANHVEHDVGGNHLIENGAALTVAGLLFEERSWTDAGESLLADATGQFLDDGYHFERSPMYHVLALTRYLTVCDLLDRVGRSVPENIQTTATDGAAFLRYLRPPDDRIPLLNDAVYGQALPLADCLRYARALGFDDGPDRLSIPAGDGDPVRTSNYRWLRTADGTLLIDGGRVGPPHLPGHSHSDTLSVLLWLGDRPVVTDTGTFGYVPGPQRRFARGVEGHNTVQVGDTEPIALGGKYLMGPRPDPETRFESGTVSLFEGKYEAVPFAAPAYTHHRAVYAGENWWLVRDAVRGGGDAPLRSRLHLHPDVDTTLESTGRVRLAVEDVTGSVCPLNSTRIGVTTGRYFPRFGVATDRPVLELRAEADHAKTATIDVLLTGRDIGEVHAHPASGEDTAQTLRVAGQDYRLPSVRL